VRPLRDVPLELKGIYAPSSNYSPVAKARRESPDRPSLGRWLYLTSPHAGPRYLELKVKFMFMVLPLAFVTASIFPFTLSEPVASTRRVPSVDPCCPRSQLIFISSLLLVEFRTV